MTLSGSVSFLHNVEMLLDIISQTRPQLQKEGIANILFDCRRQPSSDGEKKLVLTLSGEVRGVASC